MPSRIVRLSKAFWLESIKRLPYVAIILGILLLYQGYVTAAKVSENVEISRQNSETNKELLEKITDISQDNKKISQENKALSEQNNRLADQSIRYQECTFRLFAKYTRDRRPIAEYSLDKCVAENVFFGQGTSTTGNPSFQSEPQTAPAPAPAPQQTRSQADPPQRSPNALERLLRVPRGLLNFFL